jgi:ABC-type Fe3+/spermidine/putrescine transport system ATPase subunit
MSPENVFVANFIGESNFLEGYVVERDSKETLIELRGGLRVQTDNNDLKKGEKVVLAIRPEAFIIEKEEKGKNAIPGIVERMTFEGTNIRYEITLENQDTVVIVKPSMIGKWLEIDKKVVVSFPPERAHMFPYPEAGLKEELAVE